MFPRQRSIESCGHRVESESPRIDRRASRELRGIIPRSEAWSTISNRRRYSRGRILIERCKAQAVRVGFDTGNRRQTPYFEVFGGVSENARQWEHLARTLTLFRLETRIG